MAIRIIKQGSTLASKVRCLSLAENEAAPELEPSELPAWMQSMSAVEPATPGLTTSPTTPRPAAAEQSPAVDLAQVEKAAYENGFRQGEKAGMEIAEKKVEAIMLRYSDAIHELGRLKSRLYIEVERQVVKLAVEVARKIVHREIQADREIIQTLVKVALSHAAEKSAVTVHLHPVDYNYVLEHRGQLEQGQEGREVVLLADKSIERGGCLVQTECGDIDARIEEEFRELERGFFGAMDGHK
jgi:flagellar assembly protein FliH